MCGTRMRFSVTQLYPLSLHSFPTIFLLSLQFFSLAILFHLCKGITWMQIVSAENPELLRFSFLSFDNDKFHYCDNNFQEQLKALRRS